MNLEDMLGRLRAILGVIRVDLESPDLGRYPEGSPSQWKCFVTEVDREGTVTTNYFYGTTALDAVIKAYDKTKG